MKISPFDFNRYANFQFLPYLKLNYIIHLDSLLISYNNDFSSLPTTQERKHFMSHSPTAERIDEIKREHLSRLLAIHVFAMIFFFGAFLLGLVVIHTEVMLAKSMTVPSSSLIMATVSLLLAGFSSTRVTTLCLERLGR